MVAGLDWAHLQTLLRALVDDSRAQIIRQLQVPKAAAEIHVVNAEERPISRQAVENHLKVLEESGLVRRRAGKRGRRKVHEFVLNHGTLFLLLEDVKALTLMRPVDADQDKTLVSPGLERPTVAEGPGFTLVGSPLEGQQFPLEGKGPWAIGRARQHAVCLSHDPFISSKHASVEHKDGYWIKSGGRNPLQVNWRTIEEPTRLVGGDIVTVGKTVLVFRDGAL